ncbi:placenta-specific gene 8 protein-like [Mercenaria mercenaria]|uniref:placenta-specific gene 8 protein-like n=1 Tax=Mercenaria mercenaria TaxID=6596 RepID=UPI00234F47AA|nr:placenta-specific gene 8 protein-like [Mercenaria mercenaria]XP_045199217.2 placenta-specific gene 8 protein-like [Mercenaria mercenaria]XP_053397967.1 placenta-specific gene 8 protein-like [Mercenaria mercenaria]
MDDKQPIVDSQPDEYQQAQPAYQLTPPVGHQQGHVVTVQAQPVEFQQGTVITVQPGFGTDQGKLLIPLAGNRAWSSGLFDCFEDISNCLFIAFCTPCAQSQIASRMGENCCVTCCVPGAMIALRQKLRTLGGIQGTLFNDCLVLSCCGQCALCQMKREMNIMGIM